MCVLCLNIFRKYIGKIPYSKGKGTVAEMLKNNVEICTGKKHFYTNGINPVWSLILMYAWNTNCKLSINMRVKETAIWKNICLCSYMKFIQYPLDKL